MNGVEGNGGSQAGLPSPKRDLTEYEHMLIMDVLRISRSIRRSL